jgi:hypothetical protein
MYIRYRSLFPLPQFGLHLQIPRIPFLFHGKCVFLSLQCILERSKNLFPHDSNVKRLLLLAWRSAWVVASWITPTSGSAIGRSKSSNLNGLPCSCARIASISRALPKCFLPLADVIQRSSTEPTRRDHEVLPHVHAAAITISNAAN